MYQISLILVKKSSALNPSKVGFLVGASLYSVWIESDGKREFVLLAGVLLDRRRVRTTFLNHRHGEGRERAIREKYFDTTLPLKKNTSSEKIEFEEK